MIDSIYPSKVRNYVTHAVFETNGQMKNALFTFPFGEGKRQSVICVRWRHGNLDSPVWRLNFVIHLKHETSDWEFSIYLIYYKRFKVYPVLEGVCCLKSQKLSTCAKKWL